MNSGVPNPRSDTMRRVTYSNEDLIRNISKRISERLRLFPIPKKDEIELIVETAIIELAAKYAPK